MVLAHNVEKDQRTRDIQISVDVTFSSMMLSKHTLEGLTNSGFYKPSPIQLHGIPLGKCGFDLILEAKSGTGKTAVFTVIALEQLDLKKGLQSVILAPTREIATQVRDVIKQIGSSYNGLTVEVVIGGLSVEEDIAKFQKNVHILVGSPGRMRYLIQDKHVDVSAVRLMVLDEADKLMDKSFQADINYIFAALPKQKQVIMSSATYPDKSIMQNYVIKAQHICPDSTNILLGIKQLVTIVECNINVVRQTKYKFEELLKILTKQEFKQCLIFCNYQVRVEELCKMLRREKWPAEQLHGQLDQTDRLGALKTLQEYKCRILVSTDLAARGIDASNVDLVINFEPPYDWQTYLHRIGRAGRFGSFGIAITILSKGKEYSKFIENMECLGSSANIHYLWNDEKFLSDELDLNNSALDETIKIQEVSRVEDIYKTSEDKLNTTSEMSQNVIGTIDTSISKKAEQNLCKKLETISLCLNEEIVCDTPELNVHQSENIMYEFCQNLATPNTLYQSEDVLGEDLFNESKCEHIKTSILTCNKRDDSVDKSKCKFESFDELIASYKEYEPNNNEPIKFIDAIYTNKCNAISNDEIELNIDFESISDIDLDEGKKKDKCIDSRLVIHEKPNQKENDSHSVKVSSVQLNKNQFQDRIEYVCTLDSYQKALKDAGLPTAFGSNKYSNKNTANDEPVKNYERCTTNKQKSNRINYKESSNRNKCLPSNSKVRDTNIKSSTDISTSFDDDGYNTHSGLLSRSTRYIQSRNNKNRHSSASKSNVLNSVSENYDDVEFNSDAYRQYKEWYQQLKIYIQRLEMSLYINEVSKV